MYYCAICCGVCCLSSQPSSAQPSDAVTYFQAFLCNRSTKIMCRFDRIACGYSFIKFGDQMWWLILLEGACIIQDLESSHGRRGTTGGTPGQGHCPCFSRYFRWRVFTVRWRCHSVAECDKVKRGCVDFPVRNRKSFPHILV